MNGCDVVYNALTAQAHVYLKILVGMIPQLPATATSAVDTPGPPPADELSRGSGDHSRVVGVPSCLTQPLVVLCAHDEHLVMLIASFYLSVLDADFRIEVRVSGPIFQARAGHIRIRAKRVTLGSIYE